MAQLIHAIIHLFLPLEVDFSGLREARDQESRLSYAAEILRTRTGESYVVRLQKLRYWVAKVGGNHIAVHVSAVLANGQCILELVRTCGLQLSDPFVRELVALCGLAQQGHTFNPPARQCYVVPRGDDRVGSFFQKLDEAREAPALVQLCSAKVQDDLDFLGWFENLRHVLEAVHDRILSGPRDAGGEG